jgi:hypothetical protein
MPTLQCPYCRQQIETPLDRLDSDVYCMRCDCHRSILRFRVEPRAGLLQQRRPTFLRRGAKPAATKTNIPQIGIYVNTGYMSFGGLQEIVRQVDVSPDSG